MHLTCIAGIAVWRQFEQGSRPIQNATQNALAAPGWERWPSCKDHWSWLSYMTSTLLTLHKAHPPSHYRPPFNGHAASFLFSFFFPLTRFVPACLSFGPLCTSLLWWSHLFGVDYFPHQAGRIIMCARPRFVSCHLINENEWKRIASVFICTDDLIYAHPLLYLSLTVIMTLFLSFPSI